jgi:putative acetyltransferase
MNMEIKFRPEETNDIEQIREVVRAAFPTAAESRLVNALRASGKAMISLVAVQEDRVLGHILFSPVSTAPSGEAKGLGLAPVAVHPTVQSRGIGSKLIQEGLRLCKELGYDYCVVLGDPKYYRRFGFEKASQFGIQNEYGVDEEFMVIHVSDRDVAGLLKYASEFAMFAI